MRVARLSAEDKQRAFRYFQSVSGRYHFISNMGPLRLLRQREHASVLRLARFEAPAKTMIDVGCGAGFYSFAAKRAGLEVCAVDICEGMVEQVRPFVDQALILDLEELRLNRQFDIVVCSGALEFVIHPGRALVRLFSLVAPGGRLVLQVPVSGWASHLYRLEKRLFGIRVHTFKENWLLRKCRSSGLVIRAMERPLPFNLTLLLENPARDFSRTVDVAPSLAL